MVSHDAAQTDIKGIFLMLLSTYPCAKSLSGVYRRLLYSFVDRPWNIIINIITSDKILSSTRKY